MTQNTSTLSVSWALPHGQFCKCSKTRNVLFGCSGSSIYRLTLLFYYSDSLCYTFDVSRNVRGK